jgi:hypothetical protein
VTHPLVRQLAIQALAKRFSLDNKPILVGPWRSEVGFEALYWRPFLTEFAKHVPSFWDRAVIVTRGGAANLYGRWVADERFPDPKQPLQQSWVQPQSVDLYTLRSVTDIRRQNLFDWSKTRLQKQTQVTDYDRQLLRDAADVAGVSGRHHVLHPSWMYWALAPFWDEDRGLKYLTSLADYSLLPKPPTPITIDGLPAQYVAVKFYGRATWPHPHRDTMELVAHVVSTLSKQVPVVLLNSGHEGDEHIEMQVTGKNVFVLPPLPPEHNLGAQLALLGRAQAFVGTYGGVAQAALRMGVPSASFWHQFGGTAHAHLSLSSWLSKRTNVQFVTGGIADVALWQQLLMAPPAAQPKASSVMAAVPA